MRYEGNRLQVSTTLRPPSEGWFAGAGCRGGDAFLTARHAAFRASVVVEVLY